MDEDVKVEDEAVEGADQAAEESVVPKKKGKRGIIIVAVIVAVIAVAGAGAWIWHEQPSFCNAFCHVPMDEYYATFMAEPGQATVDKWGNPVSDGAAMLAATHRVAGDGCLECHVPTIGEMVGEGLAWVMGDYDFPLGERSLKNLTTARNLPADEFCLNSGCHHVTADGVALDSREALEEATSDMKRNPHEPAHGVVDCGQCHKAHRASVNYCSSCHPDSPIPDGWLNSKEAAEIIQPENK